MHAQYFILNESCEWQIIEQICEVLPDIGIAVLPHALIVEPIYLRDLSSFVISSEDCYSVSPSDFDGDQEGDAFD